MVAAVFRFSSVVKILLNKGANVPIVSLIAGILCTSPLSSRKVPGFIGSCWWRPAKTWNYSQTRLTRLSWRHTAYRRCS